MNHRGCAERWRAGARVVGFAVFLVLAGAACSRTIPGGNSVAVTMTLPLGMWTNTARSIGRVEIWLDESGAASPFAAPTELAQSRTFEGLDFQYQIVDADGDGKYEFWMAFPSSPFGAARTKTVTLTGSSSYGTFNIHGAIFRQGSNALLATARATADVNGYAIQFSGAKSVNLQFECEPLLNCPVPVDGGAVDLDAGPEEGNVVVTWNLPVAPQTALDSTVRAALGPIEITFDETGDAGLFVSTAQKITARTYDGVAFERQVADVDGDGRNEFHVRMLQNPFASASTWAMTFAGTSSIAPFALRARLYSNDGGTIVAEATATADTGQAPIQFGGADKYVNLNFACLSEAVCKTLDAGNAFVDAGGDAGEDAGPDGGEDGGDGGADAGAGADAGSEADAGAEADAGPDAGADAGAEADAGDAGADADAGAEADAGPDAGADAGEDAGEDAGADAGPDAGADAGSEADAGADAGTCNATEWNWTRIRGTVGGDEVVRGLSTNPLGAIYGVGSTRVSSVYDIVVHRFESDGGFAWSSTYGTGADDIAYAVAADTEGNAFVVGTTKGGLDGNSNVGFEDIFLSRYSPSGTRLWTRQHGTGGTDYAYGIARSSDGTLVVAGATFGGLHGNANLGGYDGYLMKFDADGGRHWTSQFGTSWGDIAEAVATDSTGNAYVTGYTYGDLDGGPTQIGSHLFVMKFNADGGVVWIRQFNADLGSEGRGVAVDSNRGAVYVAGRSSMAFDGNTKDGGDDAILVKFGLDGTKHWSREFGSIKDDSAVGVGVDPSGFISVGGAAGDRIAGSDAGGTFVAMWDLDGGLVAIVQRGPSSDNGDRIVSGFAVSPGGNAFVGGYSYVGFDGQTIAGASDAVIMKFGMCAP